MNVRRLIASTLAIVMCLISTGCWGRMELNELAITAATAVDLEGDEWVNTYQVIIPSVIATGVGTGGGGGAGSPVIVYSTKGKTIREAVSRSYSESPRKPYFAHNRIVVLSEKVARYGVTPILDVYFRNPDARESVTVLVSKGRSRKILEQLVQIQRIPGDAIKALNSLESQYTSVLPEVRIFQLAMDLSGDAGSALLPEIFISGKGETTSVKSQQKTTYPAKIRLGGLAVLKKDKMVGWMNREEALGVAFLRDKVKQTTLTIPCTAGSKKRQRSTVQVTQAQTKLVPVKKNDHIEVKVQIRAKGTLQETDCPGLDLYKPEVVKQMESLTASRITELVNIGWKAAQRLDTDVVGFAPAVHRKYRKDWPKWKKDWDARFKQIRIRTKAEMNMVRVGLSSKPMNATIGEDKKK